MHLTRSGISAFLTVSLVFASSSAFADEKAACLGASEAGQTQRDAKKLEDARRSFLACSKEECPKVVRDACQGWLQEVTQLQPTVVFRAVDPEGRDLVDVKVLVDDTELQATLTGKAIPLDPGPRRLAFVHAKLGKIEKNVVIAEGEKGRFIVAEYPRSAPPPVPPAAAPPPPGAGAPPATAPVSQEPAPRQVSGGSALPWVIGGAGAVSLVLSGIFYGSYSSKKSSLSDACTSDGRCPSSERGTIDGANSAGTLSVVTGIVGVAGIGVGTWLFLAERNRAEPRTSASLSVSPSGVALGTVSGRF